MNAFKKTPLWMIVGVLGMCSLSAQGKPNIVMFYIDDWAWNGSPVAMDDSMKNSFMPVLQMPNVEKLAMDGMKFRNAYGSPQCSPARACIQTGQSNPRNGYTVYLNSKEPYYNNQKEYEKFPLVSNVSDKELDKETVTIAEALKPLGYVSAHIGKWHLRGNPGEHGYVAHSGETTNNEGNTLKFGLAKDAPTPKRLPKDMADPKSMFSVTEEAIDFMEAQVKAGAPFYLQISHYAMHAGSECLDETREKYANHPLVQAWYKKNKKHPDTVNRGDDPALWLGMGEDLDGRIGAVLDRAQELGITDNTYFIVVGDNGYRHEEVEIVPDFKQPLHSRKWWVWDGGIRVPMIVKGPGIKSGSVFKGNVINYDFLPTFVDWAGGDGEALADVDGVSLAGYVIGERPDSGFLNRNLYFHYPHYRSSLPHSAIISGSSKVMHFYEKPEIPMLFNLASDIGEANNIAKQHPETHKKLFGEMMRYFNEVGARLPKVNPNYDPEHYKSLKDYKERLMWGPFEGRRPLEEDEI